MKYFSPSFSYTWWSSRVSAMYVGERSGNQDRPAAHTAGVEVVEGVERGIQRVLLGVQRDLPGLGQHHQLGEVVVGADDVADDVLLAADEVQRRDPQLAAVADDVLRAGGGGHLPGVVLPALLGHEVEHHGGAQAVRQVLDRVDVRAVGQHGLVRADLLGQRQRVGVAVDHDDPGGGERGQRLDADVAEAAGALHDRGRARVEVRHGLAHRVVG